jgi:hypothetical protein
VLSITIWIAIIALLGLPMARSLDPVSERCRGFSREGDLRCERRT